MGEDERDEVVAIVLLRLVQAGPRGRRVGDPDSDDAVRRYLRRALENALIDRIRASRPRPPFAPDALSAAQTSSTDPGDADVERQVDRHRAARRLDQAQQDLFGILLPWISAHRRKDSVARLQRTVDEMLRIYTGATQLQSIVAAQPPSARSDADPRASRRARYALYQQHHRAMDTLLRGVDQLRKEGQLSDDRCQALWTLLAELRIRSTQEHS
jgi:hypothetical protein